MFLFKNWSELQPILVKLCLQTAVMRTQLWIAFGVGRVKVTVPRSRSLSLKIEKNISTYNNCVMSMFIREIMVGTMSTSFLAVLLLCRHTHGFKVTTFLFLSNLYKKSRMYFTFWFLLHNIVVSTCTLHSKLTLPALKLQHFIDLVNCMHLQQLCH